MPAPVHIGLSLGRIDHWHDGLGEFSRQLGLALAAQAPRLQAESGDAALKLLREWLYKLEILMKRRKLKLNMRSKLKDIKYKTTS